MQCPQCGTVNRDRAKFCRECGTRLAAACPACGAHAEPSSNFCEECGASLLRAPAPSLQPDGVAALARASVLQPHVPRHLSERILATQGALEDERKQVTVLFADL